MRVRSTPVPRINSKEIYTQVLPSDENHIAVRITKYLRNSNGLIDHKQSVILNIPTEDLPIVAEGACSPTISIRLSSKKYYSSTWKKEK